jgi:hypothetical protein
MTLAVWNFGTFTEPAFMMLFVDDLDACPNPACMATGIRDDSDGSGGFTTRSGKIGAQYSGFLRQAWRLPLVKSRDLSNIIR